LNFLNLAESQYIRNVGMMHNVLGFVILLLLVFRTNTAYDRWWEARKILGGLTNCSRNLAIKVQAILPDAADRRFFRLMIPNYAFSLKNLLRENEDYTELDPVLDLKKEKHLPNQIAAALYGKMNGLHVQGMVKPSQLLVLNEEIRAFTDLCGAGERIQNTPIPFT
jgi:putative membrane protein